jgi:hypothetical protein
MARLASRIVEYVAEQPIRVSRAADVPEITPLRLAACPICAGLPAAIAGVSHAPVTP